MPEHADRLNITDQRTHEPQSRKDIEREFPGWNAYRGVNMLWYGRIPQQGSDWEVGPAEDLDDLRDQIIGCIRRHET